MIRREIACFLLIYNFCPANLMIFLVFLIKCLFFIVFSKKMCFSQFLGLAEVASAEQALKIIDYKCRWLMKVYAPWVYYPAPWDEVVHFAR
jgi:hypothetical protein